MPKVKLRTKMSRKEIDVQKFMEYTEDRIRVAEQKNPRKSLVVPQTEPINL